MRARIKQIHVEVLSRIRDKITGGGALFTLAVLLVGAGAVISANNLLFLILATMMSTILVSGLISRLCLAGLELDFQVPEHVSARRTISAKLFVRNVKSWMPSFSVHILGLGGAAQQASGSITARLEAPAILTSGLYFPVIPGGAVLEETVEVRFARRGAYRQNSFGFSTRFPFGFLEKTARVTLRREVLVYPCLDPQPGFEEILAAIAGEMDTHYQGLGRDFYRIRPYQAFESARHVDWKATAHTGGLQVREFAREQERAAEMFLDRDVPKGLESWFEWAVDCCAYLAWRLSQQATGIRFRSQDFDFRLPEEGDVYTILRYLALVSPQAGRPLPPPSDESSFQVVFTASANQFVELGWTPAHIVGPDSLPVTSGAAGEAGAGKDLDHSGREDLHGNTGQRLDN